MDRKLVVGAKHPVIGMLYWYFVDESSVNAPNYYGLTTEIGKVVNCAEIRYLTTTGRVSRPWFLDSLVTSNVEDGNGPVGNLKGARRRLSWHLGQYADAAGITHSDFLNWILEADWADIEVEEAVT